MQKAIKHIKLINSYRKRLSLNKLLTRAKFTYSENVQKIQQKIMSGKRVK